MKAFEFRPLVKEEFSEAPWMEKLLRPLNSTLSQIRSGLDRGLSLGDNFNAEVKALEIRGGKAAVAAVVTDSAWHNIGDPGEPAWGTGSNNGAPWTPTRFKRINGVVYVELAANVTNGAVTFTLPAGYRPSATIAASFPGISFTVASSGAVTPSATLSAQCMFCFPSDDLASSTAEVAAFPLRFATTVRGRAMGVLLLRAVSISGRNESAVAGIGGVGWDQDGSTIILRGVTGLNPGASYRLTVLVIGA